jgi:prepilin-type N-terminal cleavage/methylation domain-containing protein
LKRKGFSLIEVLIGLTILAVGLLVIAGMQMTSIKGSSFSHHVSHATILAQDKLEELKNLSYSLLISQDYVTVPDTIFLRKHGVLEDPGNSIKTVTVTVKWTDQSEHSISLITLRSNQ